jgi:ArsR family transcriptional regulator, arsenate/arsenite/antimonite-responsive transcriptional repressor
MINELEKLFKALGDRNRLRIVNMLCSKPSCVCELTHILQLSQSTVSGHLRVLKDAGIAIDHKNKLWVDYHLDTENPWINDIVAIIKKQSESDSLMENDSRLLERADRNQLCKK